MELTPEYPDGTYCYHVTIDGSGTPAFPYFFGGAFYGTASAGKAQTVPDGAHEHFHQSDGTTEAPSGSPSVDS